MKIPSLLITGTDTGVGKTYLTSLIARRLVQKGVNVGVCKPVCTGAELNENDEPQWEDIEKIHVALHGKFERDLICPYRFLEPLAPPVAARLEGQTLETYQLLDAVRAWEDRVDFLIIEGVGGLLCPLTERETVADLAQHLQTPLLIVSRLGLGTINHTLLTAEVALHRKLNPVGVLFNESAPLLDDSSAITNPKEVASRTPVPVLGVLRYLQQEIRLPDGPVTSIDWVSLARG